MSFFFSFILTRLLQIWWIHGILSWIMNGWLCYASMARCWFRSFGRAHRIFILRSSWNRWRLSSVQRLLRRQRILRWFGLRVANHFPTTAFCALLALLLAQHRKLLRVINQVIDHILHSLVKRWLRIVQHSFIQLFVFGVLIMLKFRQELSSQDCSKGLRDLTLDSNRYVSVDELFDCLDLILLLIKVCRDNLQCLFKSINCSLCCTCIFFAYSQLPDFGDESVNSALLGVTLFV